MIKTIGYILLALDLNNGSFHTISRGDGLSNLHYSAESCYKARVDMITQLPTGFTTICEPVISHRNIK